MNCVIRIGDLVIDGQELPNLSNITSQWHYNDEDEGESFTMAADPDDEEDEDPSGDEDEDDAHIIGRLTIEIQPNLTGMDWIKAITEYQAYNEEADALTIHVDYQIDGATIYTHTFDCGAIDLVQTSGEMLPQIEANVYDTEFFKPYVPQASH